MKVSAIGSRRMLRVSRPLVGVFGAGYVPLSSPFTTWTSPSWFAIGTLNCGRNDR